MIRQQQQPQMPPPSMAPPPAPAAQPDEAAAVQQRLSQNEQYISRMAPAPPVEDAQSSMAAYKRALAIAQAKARRPSEVTQAHVSGETDPAARIAQARMMGGMPPPERGKYSDAGGDQGLARAMDPLGIAPLAGKVVGAIF